VVVRARVRGFLKSRLFKDGDNVKAGQLLFIIDEEPFRVRLEQAQAKLDEAAAALRKAEQSKGREVARAQVELNQAQLTLARIEEARTRKLMARNAVTREDLDRNEANTRRYLAQVESDRASLEQANADYEINIFAAKSSLAAAKADVRSAEIDLGYCRIATPINGRINSREFDIGNYVGDGQSTVLATIVKTDPIYAYITPSEAELLQVQTVARQGKPKNDSQAPIVMEMGLGNEEGYPHKGQIDYIDPSVDTGTGTIRVRGVFPNPDGIITPGLFVRIQVPLGRREDALLVPDRVLGFDQQGSFLLVVGKDNVVERRGVTPGTRVGTMRVVDGIDRQIGLADRIVVDVIRARPDIKVVPKPEAPAPALASSSATVTAAKSHP
jgi:RND family efflux transporter MFP subunit